MSDEQPLEPVQRIYVLAEGEATGPYTRAEIQNLLLKDVITLEHQAFREGEEDSPAPLRRVLHIVPASTGSSPSKSGKVSEAEAEKRRRALAQEVARINQRVEKDKRSGKKVSSSRPAPSTKLGAKAGATIMLLLILVIAGAAAYYYFQVYLPQQEEKDASTDTTPGSVETEDSAAEVSFDPADGSAETASASRISSTGTDSSGSPGPAVASTQQPQEVIRISKVRGPKSVRGFFATSEEGETYLYSVLDGVNGVERNPSLVSQGVPTPNDVENIAYGSAVRTLVTRPDSTPAPPISGPVPLEKGETVFIGEGLKEVTISNVSERVLTLDLSREDAGKYGMPILHRQDPSAEFRVIGLITNPTPEAAINLQNVNILSSQAPNVVRLQTDFLWTVVPGAEAKQNREIVASTNVLSQALNRAVVSLTRGSLPVADTGGDD